MVLEGSHDLILRDRSYCFSTSGRFLLASIFCCIYFLHTKNQHHTCYSIMESLPPPQSNIISTVVTITKVMNEKKRIKTKVRVGSFLKSKVGEREDNTR